MRSTAWTCRRTCPVFDGDEAYDLVGCTEQGTVPLWIPHRWDETEPHELHAWV